MDIRELVRLDMNLLVALEALLEERNVSRAADRLFITQSAMSKTLGRLRDVFDDPLFIRKSGGMIPTPRAEQLGDQLPAVLRAIQAMVRPLEFDPASYDGEVRLMVQGHMGVWVLPLLMARLEHTAPRLRLTTYASIHEPLGMLARGELDLVLHAEHLNYSPDYRMTTLGYASPVLLVRKGHPLEGVALDWDLLESYPHIRLHIPELEGAGSASLLAGLENSAFLQREQEVVPRIRTDHLYTAIQLVLSSDYLFPAPPLFMEQDQLAKNLVSLALPGGEELSLKYVMVRHQRVENSPLHRFLMGEILTVIEGFRHQYGLPPLADLRRQRNLSY